MEICPQGRTYLYVANQGSQSIYVYQMNTQTGGLTFRGQVAVDGDGAPMAIDTQQGVLYIGMEGEHKIQSFALDMATGLLSPLQTFRLNYAPVYLQLDATRTVLLVSSYEDNLVAAYRILAPGHLDLGSEVTLTTGDKAHAVVTDPYQPFVWITNTGDSQIQRSSFDPKQMCFGPLLNVPTQAGDGPRHLVFHPRLPMVYVVNEYADSVTCYCYNHRSELCYRQSMLTLPKSTETNTCADIHITADGRFLYASNRDISSQGKDSIAMFALDHQGGMQCLGQVETVAIPRAFALDPDAKFVFVAGKGSHTLAAYTVDPTSGFLQHLSSYPVGQSPAWVEALVLNGPAV
ncbi:MAG: beta-propeller fold lactonase family protein [Zetaproteobacteria bacterium]|nr:beta-propeller fold lactonase family protein [Zetaproteobacteria bacterium]